MGSVRIYEDQAIVRDQGIECLTIYTDNGITVTIAGGEKSHVGAVAVIDERGLLETITLPGHKETMIANTWANRLFARCKQPVVVSVGIHYDNITAEEIESVLIACEEMLKNVIDNY